MSAPGNRAGALRIAARGGFTLLELLLVVALIAMASAGVAFALRETGDQLLEREAQRLVAQLDAARARSRATGQVVVWRPGAEGYAFVGPPSAVPVQVAWLEPGTVVRDDRNLVLGPEPIIGPQEIELALGDQHLRIATDGLRPFAVVNDTRPDPSPEAAP